MVLKEYTFFPLSGCENAKVYIWNLPKDGLTETLTEPQSYLMGKLWKIVESQTIYSRLHYIMVLDTTWFTSRQQI